MPRFVVLKHIAETTHYDLMFERDGMLRTFSAPADPREASEFVAEEIFEHPLRFLSYEGELRSAPGRVERVERGDYEIAEWAEDRLRLECRSETGDYVLIFEKTAPKRWLLKKLHHEKNQL